MLHRPQPKEVVADQAAASYIVQKADLDKELPHLPATPSKSSQPGSTIRQLGSTEHSPEKHVSTPSRSQIPTLKQHRVLTKVHEFAGNEQPLTSPSNKGFGVVTYPALAESPNVTIRKPNTFAKPATGSGNFTFRADQSIKFSSPEKPLPPNPPKTIRHVRPSGLPTPFAEPGLGGLPAIAHGIENKKRKHVDEEEDVSVEKRVQGHDHEEEDDSSKENDPRPAKKVRINAPPSVSTSPVKLNQVNQTSPLKRRFASGGKARAGHKKGLSLGRLNVLARPKERH